MDMMLFILQSSSKCEKLSVKTGRNQVYTKFKVHLLAISRKSTGHTSDIVD